MSGQSKGLFPENIGVIPSHTCAPMIQLQLQFDSEKKRRQELEALVDEYKKAKEHADAEAIKCAQHVNSLIKEQEQTRMIQASCNALLKQMLAQLGA